MSAKVMIFFLLFEKEGENFFSKSPFFDNSPNPLLACKRGLQPLLQTSSPLQERGLKNFSQRPPKNFMFW